MARFDVDGVPPGKLQAYVKVVEPQLTTVAVGFRVVGSQ